MHCVTDGLHLVAQVPFFIQAYQFKVLYGQGGMQEQRGGCRGQVIYFL